MAFELDSLIDRLNEVTHSALEAAVGLCVSRSHYDVELEHYLLKLLENEQGDFQKIAKHFDLSTSRIASELERALDTLKSGNGRMPVLSHMLIDMFADSWMVGSLNFKAEKIRSAFTILGLVSNKELLRVMLESCNEFRKIRQEDLLNNLLSIVAGSREDERRPELEGDEPAAAYRVETGGRVGFLDQYTTDLTERARGQMLDPVLGRDDEVNQIIDILMRRRQNNPILTGEAGVGKTAIVEGFAARVAKGEVPQPLQAVSVRALDLTLMQAGAGVRGEFEKRMKGLVEEIKSTQSRVILFIDEAHTLVGAGGSTGQGDAANILKPALARGELRTIAATTWSEYKKYFEKDAALARRFQEVKVDEPDETQCAIMLRGLLRSLEEHHKVRILEDAVAAAVRLSHRYLVGRQLPDKAISVLDTACARLSLAQSTPPKAIQAAERALEDLALQHRILSREVATGADHQERLRSIEQERTKAEKSLTDLRTRWAIESRLALQIHEIRRTLESTVDPLSLSATANEGISTRNGAVDTHIDDLKRLTAELDAIQGDSPLVRICVDAQSVSEVISAWTGIPTGNVVNDEVATLLDLQGRLASRVTGQDHALAVISERLITSRAHLEDPRKPVGVFLLVGPSGVGKTETALALSDLLYGGERNLITINMSEFQERHTISTLKGSPPGYVGYGEGGMLTEAVRRRPYSVVLLDEVEKAHRDVLELFYQVFDKGWMEDGEGRKIDFKNTVIVLTTNVGGDVIVRHCSNRVSSVDFQELVKALKPRMNRKFKAALLSRLVIVPYLPLENDALRRIVSMKLERIRDRLQENHRVVLTLGEDLLAELVRRCTEYESGARNIDNILTNTLLPDVSRRILAAMAKRERPESIHVDFDINRGFVYS